MAVSAVTTDVFEQFQSKLANWIGNYIKKEDNDYYIKLNNASGYDPLTHPSLSTQSSVLPQKIGNTEIYEMMIPHGGSSGWSFPSGMTSANTTIIQCTVFTDKRCEPGSVSVSGSRWQISPATFSTDEGRPFAIIQYITKKTNYFPSA